MNETRELHVGDLEFNNSCRPSENMYTYTVDPPWLKSFRRKLPGTVSSLRLSCCGVSLLFPLIFVRHPAKVAGISSRFQRGIPLFIVAVVFVFLCYTCKRNAVSTPAVSNIYGRSGKSRNTRSKFNGYSRQFRLSD